MDPSNYHAIARLQETNWWYCARRQLVEKILTERGPFESGLDLGCGVGGHLDLLGRVCSQRQGVDPSEEAVHWCKEHGFEGVFQGDATDLPLEDNAFDTVICLDVLEHIDDVAAVKEIHRVLRPGGLLVVTVPAHDYLWNENDVFSHHRRRYDRKQIRALLSSFNNLDVTYWNLTSYLPMLVYAALWRVFPAEPRNNLDAVPKLMDRPLAWALSVENRLRNWIPTPTGTSVVAVARGAQPTRPVS